MYIQNFLSIGEQLNALVKKTKSALSEKSVIIYQLTLFPIIGRER